MVIIQNCSHSILHVTASRTFVALSTWANLEKFFFCSCACHAHGIQTDFYCVGKTMCLPA